MQIKQVILCYQLNFLQMTEAYLLSVRGSFVCDISQSQIAASPILSPCFSSSYLNVAQEKTAEAA